ncbi:MAG: hypothetical protein N2378_14265 [Chloroflexaceae bacterium]|nr:hypothetical protein [Chloroflexaceae bacterium]
MRIEERYYRYPRLITAAIAWLSAFLVVLAMINLGATLLRGLWGLYGRDDAWLATVPWLRPVVIWITGGSSLPVTSIWELAPLLLTPLLWAALALFVALMLRNAFPAVRTAQQGMLVEFAGAWLPVPWENLAALKVTSDLAGERFVVLVETSPRDLTAWHRLYSFFYRFGWRPGFYITSTINEFDSLIKTILDENRRVARATEGVQEVRLQEEARSPFFQLILGPGAFFSRTETTPGEQVPAPGAPVRAVYPFRVTATLTTIVILFAAGAVWSYLGYWVRFLALMLPAVRNIPPFRWTYGDPGYVELFNAYRTRAVPLFGVEGRPDLPAPWWVLVAAHLMLLIAIPLILWLLGLLPDLESREEGLLVQNRLRRRWRLIPWSRVLAFKATEVSEQSSVLLLQVRGGPGSRLSSLLYDGTLAPGTLITSAIGLFRPLVSDMLQRLVRLEQAGGTPILQQESRSWLLWLALGRRSALDALVAEARADATTKRLAAAWLWPAARTMALLTLLPALLLLMHGLLGDRAPTPGLALGVLGLWVFGMLEWPLVALATILLDERTGGGEEDYRALALYPRSQTPRVLPLLGALLLLVVGAPVLPVLAWVGAIVWAYWLTAGLCETLYEWRGSQAALGGLLPVLWQLLLLIAFLVATR